ncbi:NIL domain-containing protein [Desulfofustis limnaeus]|uniref:4Fe-4S ferredoxin n=1 Tax=Desulfofustis limnaeus TaxID=2740163 RepID=A0ABN6LYT5_9BACT|nr:NIL domain-containing protein [Desulfofustis limnaeus]MDX9893811.1 4Fe-4S binding protein [Desulfofustis sp.]BDD85760.1 4Fe-4S ferredoxin [Desulfofustis limnaeus]
MYTRIYFFRFPKDTSDKPIIYHLIKRHEVEVNILRADILPQREGVMILELRGAKNNVKEALHYLEGLGVSIERLATRVRRDDERCFQCGACTGVCPVDALSIRRQDMAVIFDPDKCTGCGQCVLVCPVRAMEMSLGREWFDLEGSRTSSGVSR